MKCKYCQAELEEGVTLCPACGKEQETVEETPVAEVEEAVMVEETPAVETEETSAPEIKEGIKATPGKIALAVMAGIVVLALLIMLVVSGIDGNLFKSTEETVAPADATQETEPVKTVVEGEIPPDGNPNDVTCKGSYSVSNEELEASVDTVVATLGDAELTLGELQIYYWEAVYAFDSEWGSYAAELGLNVAGNMDRQLCAVGDVSKTWQQYFLDYALNAWHTHKAVALASVEAGYELEEIYQTELDGMAAQMEEMAAMYGFADADEWARNYIGPGCTAEEYMHYLETYYRGYGYLERVGQNLTVTAEEVEAFYTENEELYKQNGITKEAGKTVDVRHILLMPQNGTTGEDGYPVYSEENWAACEAEVQKIYDEWQAGDKSEESFADFAVKYSQDGNAAQGGIYEGVPEGYMVETFNDWCFDETRQTGDHGLVKTQYGYHIMFFVDSDEIWFATAEADLISQTVNAKLPEAKEKYPITIDYSAIKLGVMPQGE